jgi:hypothetical protein
LLRTRTLGAAAILVTLEVLAGSATAFAQDASAATESRPILLVGARYAAPTRWTGGLGLLIPFGKPREDGDLGDLREHRGLEVEGSAGAGGARLAFGPAFVGKPPKGPVLFAADVLGTVTRTWSSPHKASADSTYVGLEGGLVLLMVRFSTGVAHRMEGPVGLKATILTWSVGVQTGW